MATFTPTPAYLAAQRRYERAYRTANRLWSIADHPAFRVVLMLAALAYLASYAATSPALAEALLVTGSSVILGQLAVIVAYDLLKARLGKLVTAEMRARRHCYR